MKAFVFQAALLCADCADIVHQKLCDTNPGVAPSEEELKNESNWDSDDYPKGPYPNGGGEADSPQHCDHCGLFLENPLTDDGVLYVNTKAIPYMEEEELAWSEIADRAEADRQFVLAEWIRYYFAPGM